MSTQFLSSEEEIFLANAETLRSLLPEVGTEPLRSIHEGRVSALERSHWSELRQELSQFQPPSSVEVRCGEPVVRFDSVEPLSPGQSAAIQRIIQLLCPWRKGPFSLFGEEVDAEWRSDRKWARLEEALPPLAGLRLLDVGCNNGYYLLRASAHGASRDNPPTALLGLDPSESFFFAFQLFQKLYRFPNLCTSLFGIEHLEHFESVFDVILCLGIVYHQRDPLRSLQRLRDRLVPGGLALVESQCIPGVGSHALFPEARYAKAHNVYFVPTSDCLVSWMKRAGFRSVEIVSESVVTPEEQRKTPLMIYESLSDFLDPRDPTRTIEGHPAPIRTIVRGVRP